VKFANLWQSRACVPSCYACALAFHLRPNFFTVAIEKKASLLDQSFCSSLLILLAVCASSFFGGGLAIAARFSAGFMTTAIFAGISMALGGLVRSS